MNNTEPVQTRMDKKTFTRYIENFEFRELFNEMGWHVANNRASILDFQLLCVAEQRDFRIFVCNADSNGKVPPANLRRKIESKLTKLYYEHIIIFCDGAKREQVWLVPLKEAGKPKTIRETRYIKGQTPELLYQRASGMRFEFDEEENITIIDVLSRVQQNLGQNNEQITKKFYDGFKKQHTAFLKFIKGIEKELDHNWYASLMLNRLMFCYFIQKKGFLDSNPNYLRDKLKECRKLKGNGKFYNFYRSFLLTLFHGGLGNPQNEKYKELIGKIPYLNGGLFDLHELEKMYKNIDIDDEAFEAIFSFFDQYEWHLDTRATSSGNEINPDVIGYIFEKYINDRSKMGAYYTKEDITEYIAKNCIIPYLFEETARKYPKAFGHDSFIWDMLKNSEDEYIYDAVKHGIKTEPFVWDDFSDLPLEVQDGIPSDCENLIEKRKAWNVSAPADVALPTEIYREVIERRKRYYELRRKIQSGQITNISDLITLNLDIRQFAQDIIETADDASFVLYFYKSLCGITILDPTCGSGAFLFAAMNILEPLYEACITRMKDFIKGSAKGKHKFFEDTLSIANSPRHPNLQYFIYKTIILNNLYGVDIMKEAVEIAKLRLFLKLAATVDADYNKPNLGLEPLPDVDFNIKAGNTLVGAATEKDVRAIVRSDINGWEKAEKAINEKCNMAAGAYSHYKETQLGAGEDFESFKQSKDELSERLKSLNEELNKRLHGHNLPLNHNEWLSLNQPFNWYAEFYEIINNKGGFDVIIGNPPYVEYSQVKRDYKIIGYKTESCGNLYAFVTERSSTILNKNGYIGMIVQLPIVCTDRMTSIQKLLLQDFDMNFFATFDDRPGKLFDGLEHIRAAIFISGKSNHNKGIFTTGYIRWNTEFREHLFGSLFNKVCKWS